MTPLGTCDNAALSKREPLSHGCDSGVSAEGTASDRTSGPTGERTGGRSDRRTPPDGDHARKIAFAAFVRNALREARVTRAWTGTEVSRRTGISRQTINRWTRGDWVSDPEAGRVVAFCEGLGLDVAVAFGILGWDRRGPARPRPDEPPMDPDVAAILRRLADPNVSDLEKFHIRETIRYLANRPLLAPSIPKSRRSAG